MRNNIETMDALQSRLVELQQSATGLQARADAEKRPLTEDESKEIEQIFAAFEDVEADILRRQTLDELTAKLAVPVARQTAPAPRAIVEPTPRQMDAGKWGFRSVGEYLNAVVRASAKGASPDPRLIANATPTTFGTEGTGADGGFAVPPDFRTNIIQKVMGESSLLSLTDQMTSSSNSMTVPTDETTPWQSTGGIQAYWESEGGLKTQSKPALTEKTIKLNKLVALVPLTDELLEDAPAMAGYVNRKAPEKINYKVNDAIINGTGVGQPLGILASAGTITVTPESGQTADTVRYENLVNMWSRLPASSQSRSVWLANQDVASQLMMMSFPGSGNAVPVYMPPGGLSAAPYATLLGRPVVSSEAMPALGEFGDLILADMSQYLTLVKTGGVRQDISIHLWFDYDITAFRFVLRIGGQPWYNTTIARLGGQSAYGFFVALGERA